MLELRRQGWMWAAAVLVAGLLAGCASKSRAPAPVEDRGPAARSQPAPVVVEPAKALPGADNAGKPGYYTVRPGDTLIRISLDSGQNWQHRTLEQHRQPQHHRGRPGAACHPPPGIVPSRAARPAAPVSPVPAPALHAIGQRLALRAPPVASLPPMSLPRGPGAGRPERRTCHGPGLPAGVPPSLPASTNNATRGWTLSASPASGSGLGRWVGRLRGRRARGYGSLIV
jgi:lipoprotein NlpD